MNTTSTYSPLGIVADNLRRKESATAAALAQIDDKLSRLDAARRDRATALVKIRHELVRVLEAGQTVSDNVRQNS